MVSFVFARLRLRFVLVGVNKHPRQFLFITLVWSALPFNRNVVWYILKGPGRGEGLGGVGDGPKF